MDWPYLHLITNHFPVVLTVLGTAAVLGALMLRRPEPWVYAVFTLTLAGVAAVPAFVTGNQAEEVIERQPGITRQALESHEEAGEAALWILLGMGVVGAFALWRTRRASRGVPPPWLRGLVTVAALAGTVAVTYAGWQGGKIFHGSSSVSSDQAAANGSRAPAAMRQTSH